MARADAGGNVFIADTGNNRVRKLTLGGARIIAQPEALDFVYSPGVSTPRSQTITVTSSSGTLSLSAAASAGWFSITPASASTLASFVVSVNAAGLDGANHSGTITISATGASNTPLIVVSADQ